MLTSDTRELQSRFDSAACLPEDVQNRFTDSHPGRPLLQNGSLSIPHRRPACGTAEVVRPSVIETKKLAKSAVAQE